MTTVYTIDEFLRLMANYWGWGLGAGIVSGLILKIFGGTQK